MHHLPTLALQRRQQLICYLLAAQTFKHAGDHSVCTKAQFCMHGCRCSGKSTAPEYGITMSLPSARFPMTSLFQLFASRKLLQQVIIFVIGQNSIADFKHR